MQLIIGLLIFSWIMLVVTVVFTVYRSRSGYQQGKMPTNAEHPVFRVQLSPSPHHNPEPSATELAELLAEFERIFTAHNCNWHYNGHGGGLATVPPEGEPELLTAVLEFNSFLKKSPERKDAWLISYEIHSGKPTTN